MSRERKIQIIDELKEAIARCSLGVLTDYRGLKTLELTSLRSKLRQSGVEYRVVKNTLARFAAERAGKSYLTGSFEGPVAIAFGYDDVTEPARALVDYIRSSGSTLTITGGFLGDRLLTSAEVTTLSKLPSRGVLLANALAGMKVPIIALVNCLTNPLRGVAGILQARIKQLEDE